MKMTDGKGIEGRLRAGGFALVLAGMAVVAFFAGGSAGPASAQTATGTPTATATSTRTATTTTTASATGTPGTPTTTASATRTATATPTLVAATVIQQQGGGQQQTQQQTQTQTQTQTAVPRTVVAPPSTGSAGLAEHGSHSTPWLGAGIALLLGGVSMLGGSWLLRHRA